MAEQEAPMWLRLPWPEWVAWVRAGPRRPPEPPPEQPDEEG